MARDEGGGVKRPAMGFALHTLLASQVCTSVRLLTTWARRGYLGIRVQGLGLGFGLFATSVSEGILGARYGAPSW